MAGYSGTPLAKKLGIKEDASVLLSGAPAGFEETLEGLPSGVQIARSTRAKGPFDVIVAFVEVAGGVAKAFESLAPKLTPAGGLWIAWPKAEHRKDAELTETLIREVGLRALDGALVDNKVCAVSEVWSGLRFVRRLDRR